VNGPTTTPAPGVRRYLGEGGAVPTVDEALLAEIIAAVIQRVNTEFSPDEILAPSEAVRRQIGERIAVIARAELRRRNLMAAFSAAQEQAFIQRIIHQTLGLGFLEELLPPGRTDVSEIMVNQDGTLWVMPRGARRSQPVDAHPSAAEVRLVIDKLLGPQAKALSEANPVVSARLPRSVRLPAGARVNIVGLPIANGEYPIVNIRLYEDKPVTPQQILAWGMANEEIMDFLQELIAGNEGRVMIAGGTASGKTTLLSVLCNYIHSEARIVLIEEPAEIFIAHPHVVSMEARPPSVEGKYGVPLGTLVTTAMRQSPEWLVVGEVRTGQAAVWLLRAQMSDHPGLSTVHAESPAAAVDTLCLLALMDMDVRFEATKRLITHAIRTFVQVGFDRRHVRRVLRVTRVEPELKHGNVFLHDVFRFDEQASTAGRPVWIAIADSG